MALLLNNCTNAKWNVIIAYFISLAGVLIFAKGFFPIKISTPGHADYSDVPPVPLGSEVISKLLEEDFSNFQTSKLRQGQPTYQQAHYNKLVLVVIDAMRSDFISDAPYKKNMPFLQKTLSNGNAMVFTANAKAPTVTMPRLKALTTGSIPGYIDVIFNMDQSVELKSDNLISGLKRAGKTIVFYGDDTWIRLFPNSFARYDGTTSFFVTDYTEVDNNVTRHIDDELNKNKDWDVMILHYLGLDHIGHLAGPTSPLMPSKLKEMDLVVEKVYSALEKEDKPLLVITSDHGMSSQGSHGGTTHPETATPLVFLSPKINEMGIHNNTKTNDVEQVDFVSTISLSMGLPIPRDSMGKLIPDVLQFMEQEELLHAMQYNCHQLLSYAHRSGKLPDPEDTEKNDPANLYRNGVQFHSVFLSQNKSGVFGVAKDYYQKCQQVTSNKLTSKLASYNYFEMFSGFIILLIGLCCVLGLWMEALLQSRHRTNGNTPSARRITRAMVALAVGFFLFIATLPGSSFVEEEHQTWYFLSISMSLGLFIALLRTIARVESSSKPAALKTSSLYDAQIREGDVALRMRKVASSKTRAWHLVQEDSSVDTAHLLENESSRDKDFTEDEKIEEEKQHTVIEHSHRKYVIAAFVFLIIHRLLRSWNQSGIKYATDPDIGDWLNIPQNKVLLSGTSFISLMAVFLLLQLLCSTKDIVRTILFAFGICGVYMYRLAIGTVSFPWYYNTSNMGLNEAQIVYLTIGLLLIKMLYHCLFQICDPSRKRTRTHSCTVPGICPCLPPKSNGKSLDCLQCAVVILSALLLRPHNHCALAFILALYWVMFRLLWPLVIENNLNILEQPLLKLSSVQKDYFLSPIHLVARVVLSHWFGQMAHYALGNSNSLASVDVSAAYVGLSGSDGWFHFICAGILGVYSTYVGPILWTTLSMLDIINLNMNEFADATYSPGTVSSVNVAISTFAALRLFTLAVYVAVATGHRYHLFVWSVFSPKLLYELVSTALNGFLLVGFVLLL
ncbi:GPI ethanolamine phosphate transferase 2, catalytic subunit-like isoform X1 [Clavelina lepadiformis]|uniref:GPI ethanolamine phosphate transferase 2, catalytic subunit-like isoform X1 n=2 Tax=Clavelina lepadiformis TaxID=159417 RepID=UPI00404165EB